MMAFVAGFDGTTLTIDQTLDDGVVFIDNNGPGGEFQVTDLTGTDTYDAATNVVVNFVDSLNSVVVQIDSAHGGDVELNLGNGERDVTFVGSDNTIDGDLSISAGGGNQNLLLSQFSDLAVGGNITFDTGLGNDSFTSANEFIGGGEVRFTGVNDVVFNDRFEVNDVFSVDNSSENTLSRFEQQSGASSLLLGGFEYLGGSGIDQVAIDQIEIEGEFNANLGDGFAAGVEDHQLFLTNFVIDSLNISSGDNDSNDVVGLGLGVIFGDVSIDVGNGLNQVFINNTTIDGSTVSITGGSNANTLDYSAVGNNSQTVEVDFGAADDLLVLGSATATGSLHVDFGDGNNDLINGVGQFTFDAQLNSLDGFDHSYDSSIDSLTSTEISDPGVGLHVFSRSGVNSTIFVNGSPITPVTNLDIRLLDDGMTDLDVNLDTDPLAGDLTIDLGSANRRLELAGVNNRVMGDVSIVAGTGNHGVELDHSAAFLVDGTLSIDLGLGTDFIDDFNLGINIGGDVLLTGVNFVENTSGTVIVGGDFMVDIANDNRQGFFLNSAALTINGDFDYAGGLSNEYLRFDSAAGSLIVGNFDVDLAGNESLNTQEVVLDTNTSVGGNVTVRANGDAELDGFASTTTTNIGGNTLVDLGDGPNAAVFTHVNGGESVRYFGGDSTDQVVYEATGTAANVFVNLGADADSFLLGAAASVNDLLRIDFGGGEGDLFGNDLGTYTFDASLFDFNGFTSFYDVDSDSLRVKQTADFGDIEVENGAGPITVINDVGPLELTPATNLSVTMRADTNSDLGIDLDSPLAGDLNLRLRRSDRDVFFVGNSNEIGGDLRINSSTGVQNIHLAETTALTVGGDAVINLRTGSDSIDAKHVFSVGSDLILRSVNEFEVTNGLTVTGNFTHATFFESEDTRLDNDSLVDIGGRFTYLGGEGADNVLLAGNLSIGDVAYIDLGSSNSGITAQTVDLSNGFAQDRLTILAETAPAGNNIVTDAATRIAGEFNVNFSNSTSSNSAILRGQYDAATGAFRGGSGNDNVTFGAVAIDTAFATLFGDGDDELLLENNADLLSKFVDFGDGVDSLTDEAIKDFPLSVINFA